jgi:hypothetical protein
MHGPNIIIPQWNKEAVKEKTSYTAFMRDLERHLRYEADMREHKRNVREMKLRQQKQILGTHKPNEFGRAILSIPAEDFILWHQDEPGCWGDDQFVHEWHRDNPSHRITQ